MRPKAELGGEQTIIKSKHVRHGCVVLLLLLSSHRQREEGAGIINAQPRTWRKLVIRKVVWGMRAFGFSERTTHLHTHKKNTKKNKESRSGNCNVRPTCKRQKESANGTQGCGQQQRKHEQIIKDTTTKKMALTHTADNDNNNELFQLLTLFPALLTNSEARYFFLRCLSFLLLGPILKRL